MFTVSVRLTVVKTLCNQGKVTKRHFNLIHNRLHAHDLFYFQPLNLNVELTQSVFCTLHASSLSARILVHGTGVASTPSVRSTITGHIVFASEDMKETLKLFVKNVRLF